MFDVRNLRFGVVCWILFFLCVPLPFKPPLFKESLFPPVQSFSVSSVSSVVNKSRFHRNRAFPQNAAFSAFEACHAQGVMSPW